MSDENYDKIIHKNPGCNTYDRIDDIKPIIWRKPDTILVQNGTNNLTINGNKIIKPGKQQKIGRIGWKKRDKAWIKERKVEIWRIKLKIQIPKQKHTTEWKMSVFRVLLDRIQSEYGKIWTRKTPDTDTFHKYTDICFQITLRIQLWSVKKWCSANIFCDTKQKHVCWKICKDRKVFGCFVGKYYLSSSELRFIKWVRFSERNCNVKCVIFLLVFVGSESFN